MAELKYLTVVYKYFDSYEFRAFFKEQVADRNCAYGANKNKLIQTTAWYDGDALEDLEKLRELKDACSCHECGEIFVTVYKKNTICKDCFHSGCGESAS